MNVKIALISTVLAMCSFGIFAQNESAILERLKQAQEKSCDNYKQAHEEEKQYWLHHYCATFMFRKCIEPYIHFSNEQINICFETQLNFITDETTREEIKKFITSYIQ